MDLKHSTHCLIFLFILLVYLLYIALANSYVTLEVEKSYCSTDQNRTVWKCNHIPEDIPDGFSHVDIEIRDLDIYCHNTSFQSNNWQHVKSLRLFTAKVWAHEKSVSFYDYCFRNLKHLKYLGINIDYFSLYLAPNVFTELNSVTALSLANCVRLDWSLLQEAFDGRSKLPNLSDLDLSSVDNLRGPVFIDENIADALRTRNITHLNLCDMQLAFLNLTALLVDSLKYLTHLNLSSANVNDFRLSCKPEELVHLKLLDITNVTLPKSAQIVGPRKVYNIHVTYDQLHDGMNKLFYIRNIIANGLYSKAIIELYNCELILNQFIHMQTENVEFRNNGLRYIDAKVTGDNKYRNLSIKHIDLSHNDMHFLHPTIFSTMPNLISLRLTENNLGNMLKTNIALFEKLFLSNDKLQILDMSTNGLELIPKHQFIYNTDLEEINLSNNLLQQVHWDMGNLTQLKVLDLRNNKISLLDTTSLNQLNSLISALPNMDQLLLELENNPLSCSQCESKPFITWLMKTSSVRLPSQTLTCSQEDGDQGNIDKLQVEHIQFICIRETIIISCTTTLGTLLIGVVILTYVLIHRRKIRRLRIKRDELLANIQQGEGEFEFVTMLSYNSQEEEFIRQYVLDPLNNMLQTITGVDRELVLTGDQHFRPGFMVHNEIASSLDRVSFVLLLITNDFCTSGFCLSELDQAWIQRKPMIFMFKDDVDENIMTPIMKTIYKKNVRILWTMEDGEYVLKTTWENVCHAILELIIN